MITAVRAPAAKLVPGPNPKVFPPLRPNAPATMIAMMIVFTMPSRMKSINRARKRMRRSAGWPTLEAGPP